jgi:nucleoside-diphosphate-sugar epimerase
MANPILVTGAAGRVGAVGRTVSELLLKQGKAVRAMIRHEDQRYGKRLSDERGGGGLGSADS